MSNTRTATKTKKQAYLFMFPSNEAAASFLVLANQHSSTSYAQHPLNDDGLGSRYLDRVLVTGSGSFVFDLALTEYLSEKAKEFGGYLWQSA